MTTTHSKNFYCQSALLTDPRCRCGPCRPCPPCFPPLASVQRPFWKPPARCSRFSPTFPGSWLCRFRYTKFPSLGGILLFRSLTRQTSIEKKSCICQLNVRYCHNDKKERKTVKLWYKQDSINITFCQ